MAGWEDMTVQDLLDMGISLEEFEEMLDSGRDPFGTDYDSMGIMSPMDISPQATQWDVLDAQKTARKVYRPATPSERRQDRGFFMPEEGAFPYDAVAQANPYIRELLNTAISGSKPGPNQAFDVEQYVFGKIANSEDATSGGYDPEKDVGKSRIGKAVTSALPDFDYIAEQFHSGDRRWATANKSKQRQLLQEWLSEEASANLEGSAPSVARNVNFSDWATSRQGGEPFGFGGAGFDRGGSFEEPMGRGGPRVQLDPQFWGNSQTEGMTAQMSVGDFKKAYADTLASQLGDRVEQGMRIEDPEGGGYWVVNRNSGDVTPLESQRAANRRFNARQERNKKRSDERSTTRNKGSKSWWEKNVTGPLSSMANPRSWMG